MNSNQKAQIGIAVSAVEIVSSLTGSYPLLIEAYKKIKKDNGSVEYEVRGTVNGTTAPVTTLNHSELLMVYQARIDRNAERLAEFGIIVIPDPEAVPAPLSDIVDSSEPTA